MPEPNRRDGPDSRPARREAVAAAVLWGAALVVTVGVSTWLNGRDFPPLYGIPSWALLGVFVPWALFFLLHLRFYRKRTAPQAAP